MSNLGSGGEAKASPADEEDTAPIGDVNDLNVDQTERGGTMDTALAMNEAAADTPADDVVLDEGVIAPHTPRVGYGETAAYGETVENAPAPTAPGA